MDQLAYIKQQWGLTGNQADEIVRFVDNKIRPNGDWVEKVQEKADTKGVDYETQLLYEAHWMLYDPKSSSCKYCTEPAKKGGMAMGGLFSDRNYWTGIIVGVAGLLLYQNYVRPALKNR